jgi:iron complex transport system substrate-binding protein
VFGFTSVALHFDGNEKVNPMKTLRLTLAVACAFAVAPLWSAVASATTATPACVVSLSPSATETLYAIGAGGQVQAVDTDSNYPSGLPAKRIDALNPSVEAVAGICAGGTKPSLVVISYNPNSFAQKLGALGIKVVEQDAPTTVAGAVSEIRQLGQLTGHTKAANSLATSITSTITRDEHSVGSHPGKTLTGYYEIDPTYYSIDSSTFVGALLSGLGVHNIADAESTTADAGYPQLSSEYIVSASPKIIFLADTVCCKVNATMVGARPGWSTIAAVRDHEVIGLNDDIASRWGPRLVTLMNELTAAVKAAYANASLWK